MYLKLRIIFTILSALCIAAVVPVGAFLGWIWAGLCAVVAFFFYLVMRICKVNQEIEEARATHADFLDTPPNEKESKK